MTLRGIFGERAVTYTLHTPTNDHVADHLDSHPSSPVSRARAPRHPEGAHRASERM